MPVAIRATSGHSGGMRFKLDVHDDAEAGFENCSSTPRRISRYFSILSEVDFGERHHAGRIRRKESHELLRSVSSMGQEK